MSIVSLQACTLQPEWVSHSHDYHQLIFATCGTTELSIEGRGNRITGDTGCLIPSSYHHDYIGDGANNTLVINLPTNRLPLLTHSDDVERLFEKPAFYKVPPPLQQMGSALADQAGKQPGLHDEIALLILRSIYLGQFDHPLAPPNPEQVRHTGRLCDQSLHLIDEHIDQHLAHDIRVDDLARLCFLSPGYFYQAFRDYTGLTPMAYVMNRRMATARSLLTHTDLQLSVIAEKVGFRDQGSFSRACRRHFGNAPSHLRT
ncbi:AraC family transcriptional regulator [Marinobacter sp. UBA2688]|uniref:AraC family transcriptional regulator n=1 Tax=Marinobacter sp. UBA2688 TaxID=1946816 RepID=UPI00257F07D9|nr:AraC family transcriptional regulator [Marinobacter sp. UBA2688]|tara:strand:- start:1614 stop:2390 length:777 start_codon:yes stop_codon:yes gene_type:complete